MGGGGEGSRGKRRRSLSNDDDVPLPVSLMLLSRCRQLYSRDSALPSDSDAVEQQHGTRRIDAEN